MYLKVLSYFAYSPSLSIGAKGDEGSIDDQGNIMVREIIGSRSQDLQCKQANVIKFNA